MAKCKKCLEPSMFPSTIRFMSCPKNSDNSYCGLIRKKTKRKVVGINVKKIR